MRLWALAALTLLLAVVGVTASSLSYDVSDMVVSVASFDGGSRLRMSYANKKECPAEPKLITTEPDDIIRVNFAASLSNGEKATGSYLPHQAWIVLQPSTSPSSAAPAVWPLKLRSSKASASWSIRMDRLPEALKKSLVGASVDETFELQLMLGSFAQDAESVVTPLALPLLRIHFPSSLVSRLKGTVKPSVRVEAGKKDGFLPWPANKHTFQVEPWQTMPPAMASLLIALIVLIGPWILLLSLCRPLVGKLSLPDVSTAIVLASVCLVELLAVLYWIGAPVWTVFPAVGAVGLVVLVGGHKALSRTWIHV